MSISRPVNHSVNNNLNWVRVSQQMDDFHGMFNNPNSKNLLAVVTTVHHERVCKPLHNWALSFPEPFYRIPPSSVRNISCVLSWHHSNIISQWDVANLQVTEEKKCAKGNEKLLNEKTTEHQSHYKIKQCNSSVIKHQLTKTFK